MSALSHWSGQFPRTRHARLDETAVDAFPPLCQEEVLPDVRRWAPPAQPVDLRPARSRPEPPPLSREGRLGKSRIMGVDIIGPWYGPVTKHWFAIVPGPDGDRKAEALTEQQLYGVITEMLQRGR